MRKIIWVLFLLVALAVPALAHPPIRNEMKLNNGQLDLTVRHSVFYPAEHFVKLITVSLNGKNLIQQNFTFQFEKKIQKAVYFIPGLKKGDVLEVESFCNKFGSLKTKLMVP